ncbi:hypothetical protein D3C80_2005120 [compost metagenome]
MLCAAWLSPLASREPAYSASSVRLPPVIGFFVDTPPPNSEVRLMLVLLSFWMSELAFLLAWVFSLSVMVMMSPTRKALRSL